MTGCRTHRPRYARLRHLPSVRAGLGAAVAGTTGVTLAAAAGSWPAAAAVGAALAGATTWYLRRHRSRLLLEHRMIRALLASRDRCTPEVTVSGLDAEVAMAARSDGTTAISAGSWTDAVVAMGYVCGRDRGSQMDTMRRTAAGRLAEVWGRPAARIDQRYRPLDFAAAAERAFARLDAPERSALTAYSQGVNEAWRQHGPPFEGRFLGYRPQPWRPVDSILVGLYVFHALSWSEPAKRAEAVIRQVFPVEVAEFFLSERHGAPRTPPEGLGGFRQDTAGHPGLVGFENLAPGSNCWAGEGAAGPLLACDLHLPLAVPNLLYEVDLTWPDEQVRGVVVPGIPTVLVGRNRRLAWGVTNLCGDVLDVVAAAEAGAAWQDRDPVAEPIRVRQRPDEVVEVKRVDDLVSSPEPLLGRAVAVRWAGYDPRAWDLRLQRLVHTRSVAEATQLLRTSQGIALNVLLSDTDGEMAHLVTGLLRRRSPDGDGWLEPQDRPFSTSTPVVSANDNAFPDHRFGFDLDPGFRAARIRQRLTEQPPHSEQDASDLQHDTAADLYLAYRDLAVRALDDASARRDQRIRRLLAGWSGHADPGSRAFSLLVGFRQVLAERVLGPYFVRCREREPGFSYRFRALDEPLLGILQTGDPGLLPPDTADWAAFIRDCVQEAMTRLRGVGRGGGLPPWGVLNSFQLAHPLVAMASWSARLLCLPVPSQAGSTHSVRTCVPGFGAAVRAVFDLAEPSRGATDTAEPKRGRTDTAEPSQGATDTAEPVRSRIDLPAGQSGHPLSPHYSDRHRRWLRTAPRAPRTPTVTCRYTLRPAARPTPDRPKAQASLTQA